MWPHGLIILVAGLFLLLMIWYLRERRHSALFAQLAPLLDAHLDEMQVAGPIRGGEDRMQGCYRGRDVLLALREPDRGHEAPRFRMVWGSATNMPFFISVQKRMLLGIVSQIQRGRAVTTGDKNTDRIFYVTELTALPDAGFFQKMFGGAKASIDFGGPSAKKLAAAPRDACEIRDTVQLLWRGLAHHANRISRNN